MIFRYIFQSACQNRKYELQYLCYKREQLGNANRRCAEKIYIGVWRSLVCDNCNHQKSAAFKTVKHLASIYRKRKTLRKALRAPKHKSWATK